MEHKGLFITFEGADGCGKSTQIKFLGEKLKEQGYDVVLTREPGGCPIAEKIRDMVLDKENTDILDITEAYLYAASRAQHVHELIIPSLEQGKIVLCDRFVHSSVAYQGYGRQLGVQRVLDINKHAIAGCVPDYVFFMKVDPKLGFERMKKRKGLDRLETQEDSFYKRMFDGYMEISNSDQSNMIVIDASGTKFETKDIIFNEFAKIIEDADVKMV